MKTNSLKFRATKQIGEDQKITVNIRLNDECKNGHQDFSITGEVTERGRFEMGGCIHEEIEKHFPEFKIFINLHLADHEGIPMYAVENGFYHLTNGFERAEKGQKAAFCEYYRVTPQQYDELLKCENTIQYAVKLDKLGILKQWKKEANKAIKLLEKLTGDEFVVDSKKSQYHAPTPEQLKEEEKKQKSGFYSVEAKQERAKEKVNKKIAEMEEEASKKIEAIKKELEVTKKIFLAGGEKAIDNTIFYTHSNEIKFNWKSYGKQLSPEEIEEIKNKITLPDGVKYQN